MAARARESVSACVIARDEEDRLPGCLASLAFCDEIVVVDGGSSDRTVEIARAAGARVVSHEWRGFGAQRNVALDHATGDWVLEVDADERVSGELRAEIEAFLAAPPPGIDIGGLPIRHTFLGRPLGPSAKHPDYRHRLFRRDSYRHDESRTVHEGLWPKGPVHPFSGELDHLLASGVGEAVRDAWSYSRAEAAQMRAPAGPLPYLNGIVLRPIAKLPHRLVVLGGWRDGPAGALKIALDVVSDALVWIRVLAGRAGRAPARGDAGHFSVAAPDTRSGKPRVVAVAKGAAAARGATEWLERAGADGVVVTDAPEAIAPGTVRVRGVRRAGAFHVARAVEAEHQLRPIDALVAAGPREQRLLRFVPAGLHGVGIHELDADPVAVTQGVETALR